MSPTGQVSFDATSLDLDGLLPDLEAPIRGNRNGVERTAR